MTEVATPRFQAGGTLREGALYVERAADAELLAALRRGEFCYISAPRQIGKSSLRARVDKRLRQEGFRCGSVDLTLIGTVDVTAEQWYFSLLEQVATRLCLPDDPADFWARRSDLPPVHRWCCYLHEEILPWADAPVVIFIDEIDTVLDMALSGDDLFTAVRALYNARADDPSYERLTFCLIGVAPPASLARTQRRTPFNIGRRIRLDDFSRAEAQAFLPGLSGLDANPRALLDAVYHWTEGHPFITQAICEELVRRGAAVGAPVMERVEGVVEELFLRGGRAEVALFTDTERRLISDPRAGELLSLYRRLLTGERVAVEAGSDLQLALRLAGIAAERRDSRGACLRVRNLIFARVFDRAWLREREKHAAPGAAVES